MYSILIVDEMHDSLFPMLEAKGYRYDYFPKASREEIIDLLEGKDGLIIRSKTPVNKELLAKAKQLKFVGRAGAGLDTIDIPFLNSVGITLCHAAEGNCDALAEHVLGLLLGLTNKIVKSHNEIKSGVWLREPNRGFEINGRTVGVIGYGNMGKATAKRLKAMGCTVLSYDKYLTDYSDDVVQESSLEDLFRECEVVSLHVPLTEETLECYNSEFFSNFKNDIFFINAARGKVVDYAALIKALDSGKLKGVALDVFENEKLNTLNHEEQARLNNLLERDNVIVTPHVGGWSFESYYKINEVLVKKIANI